MTYYYTAVDCGTPDAPDDNGSVTYVATTFNNTATYSCNAGYYVDTVRGGSEIIVCLANGEWSDTAPACKGMADKQACHVLLIILHFFF